MRKPVLIGLTAAAAATMFAGGVSFASNTTDPDRTSTHARVFTPNAAIDTASELKFTAIAPCRAVDTRRGGGDLNSDTTRNFRVGGATSFAGQGGPSAGCGLPTNPVAITATITTVAHHNGYLKAWAAGASQPATSFLNYGTAVNASVGGIIPVSSSGVISVFNHGGPTDVIVDITGYYVQPLYALVDTNGSKIAGPRVVSISHTSGSGIYNVTFDRTVGGCAVVATQQLFGDAIDASTSGTVAFVHIYDSNTKANADSPFGLVVTC